jgi:hypothetical protein
MRNKNVFFVGFFAVVVILIMGLTACSDNTKPSSPKIVEKSAPKPPEWILKGKTDATFMYFVGMAEQQPSLGNAKKAAVSEATKALIDYIGIRVTRKLSYKATGSEADNVSTLQQQIQESIEGKGNAKVSVEVEDTYYEKYSDGSYTLYVLVKLPKKWIEKERERQQKLIEQQRSIAKKYLSDAQTLTQQQFYQPAIEALWQGLQISGKAAENEDVYEEIRTTLLSLYQKLSLQLSTEPRYAYTEGGCDPIQVQVIDTEQGKPVAGIPVVVLSGEAKFVANGGTTTDAKGKISFTIPTAPKSSEIKAKIALSFDQYSNIIAADSELAEQLAAYQEKNHIPLKLKVSPKVKAIPTVVIVLQKIVKDTKSAQYKPNPQLSDMLASLLAEKGFFILDADRVTEDLFTSEKVSKDKILAQIRNNNKEAKRVLYVTIDTSVLGDMSKTTGMNTLAGMYSVEVRLVYALIDLANNQVNEGSPIKEKGIGLSEDQATQKALKATITSLVSYLDEVVASSKK